MTSVQNIPFNLPQNIEVKEKETLAINAIIYQPYPFDQILLPDCAQCLAIETFLRMCNVKYITNYKENVEEMSPTGKVPLVKFGNELVTDLRSAVKFLSDRDISLNHELVPTEKVDMVAYFSLVNETFQNAEEFCIWVINENRTITEARYCSKYPWPLNIIKSKQKYSKVKKQLSLSGWLNKTLEEVLHEVDLCCRALSSHISPKKYFFGEFPTEFDAQLFGHIFAILTTALPNNKLSDIVLSYPKLSEHCKFIEESYYDTKL